MVVSIPSVFIALTFFTVLSSFVMAPNYQPLVNSVQELADYDKVEQAVQKGMGADVTITVRQQSIIRIIILFEVDSAFNYLFCHFCLYYIEISRSFDDEIG